MDPFSTGADDAEEAHLMMLTRQLVEPSPLQPANHDHLSSGSSTATTSTTAATTASSTTTSTTTTSATTTATATTSASTASVTGTSANASSVLASGILFFVSI